MGNTLKKVKAELISTDYPLFENQFEGLNSIPCTLVYGDYCERAEFITNDDFFFAIENITSINVTDDGITFENEDFFWQFAFV